MIEFKDGKRFVRVEKYYDSDAVAILAIGKGHFCSELVVTKETYHLLQQAMPHIEAIVDGDAPEIFPGTNEALAKLGVRKE